MTPLEKTYRDVKSKYPDAVVWFPVKDYMESFWECAQITSNILGTQLTERPNGDKLTGFPVENTGGALEKMILAGHKVAIVDEMNYGHIKN